MSNLGDELGRAAGEPEPELDLGALHARARRRGRTKRAAAASGACALLLLVGGVAWRATQGGGAEQQVTAGVGGDVGGSDPSLPPSSTTTEAAETTTSTPETVPPTLVPETTTSLAPTTTAAPPPTTTVLAGPRTIEASGTYSGNEQYRFDTTECARAGMELSHVLSSVWTPTSITGAGADLVGPGAWDVKHDYCSKAEGDRWSGSGQFAISLPGHETLQGTFDDSTAYPTDGEPYQLRIEQGEGPFAGATGVCDLTVRITDKRLGAQTQSGEFRCVLTLPAEGSSGGTLSAPDSSASAAFG